MASSPPKASLTCECGRSFTRIENLRRHQRNHQESRRLACPTCGRTFHRPDVLKRHLRTHRSSSTESLPRSVSGSSSSTRPPFRATVSGPAAASGFMGAGHSRPQAGPSTVPTIGAGSLGIGGSKSSGSSSPSLDNQLGLPLRLDPNARSLEAVAHAAARTQLSTPLSASHERTHNASPVDQLLNPLLGDAIWDQSNIWMPHPTFELPWNGETLDTPGANDLAFLESISEQVSKASAPADPQTTLPGQAQKAATNLPPLDQRIPSNGALHVDHWPNHYGAPQRRAYVPGQSGTIDEVLLDPATDPVHSQWSPFFLDAETYAAVKASLSPADTMPGRDAAFRMPSSLWTVNTLISIYLGRYYPQFPIIHLPTFEISKAPPLLVAGFLAVGACISDLPGSPGFAIDLVEMIRKTLSALFEMDSHNLRTPDMVHVAMLNCIAGLSMGHQRSFELAEIARGMLVQLCRKMHLLETPANVQQLYGSMPHAIPDRWRFWIALESRKRLGLAVYFVDAMFPPFLDMPSHLSQGEMLSTSLPCDERYWDAPTAEAWGNMLGIHGLPQSSFFATGITGLFIPRYAHNAPAPIRGLNPFGSLCLIYALHHHIWEFRSQMGLYQSIGVVVTMWNPEAPDQPPMLAQGFEGRRRWIEDALNSWRDEYYASGEGTHAEAGRLLYHLGHIALRAQLRDLYAVAGSESPAGLRAAHARAAANRSAFEHGQQSSLSVVPQLKNWVRTADAAVAAEHAAHLLLIVHFPQTSGNRHVPASIFVAILCLWVFIKHGGMDSHFPGDAGFARDLAYLFSTPATAAPHVGPHGIGAASALAVPKPADILRAGMRWMVNAKGWKMTAAFGLVLSRVLEQEEAAAGS